MARKIYYVALIVVLMINIRLGMSAPDWVSELTQGIQQQVDHLTKDINAQIENSLRPALANVEKAIQNLPRDSQGRIITNGRVITNGNIISTSIANGISKTIISSHEPNGLVRIIDEQNDGHYLYHNETIFNPKTNSSESFYWKLDLTSPNAKPELILV